MLGLDCTKQQIFQNPVKFVAKKASSIGNIVSPSLFLSDMKLNETWLNTQGFFKCGHHRCKACAHVTVTKEFTSFSTHKIYPIKQFINCNTKMFIYLISCTICRVQYIESTTNLLEVQICRHLSDLNDQSHRIILFQYIIMIQDLLLSKL